MTMENGHNWLHISTTQTAKPRKCFLINSGNLPANDANRREIKSAEIDFNAKRVNLVKNSEDSLPSLRPPRTSPLNLRILFYSMNAKFTKVGIPQLPWRPWCKKLSEPGSLRPSTIRPSTSLGPPIQLTAYRSLFFPSCHLPPIPFHFSHGAIPSQEV